MSNCYRPATRDFNKRRMLQDFWLQSLKIKPGEITVDPLSKDEWLEARKKGIGASDVPILFGLNKYSSPKKVYESKFQDPKVFDTWADSEDEKALDPAMPSEAADTGSVKEDFVAWQFERRTGLKSFSPVTIFQGVSKVQASIDRLVLGEKAILEIKTVNAYAADDWANGRIPEKVLYQVQAQLSAFDKSEGVFAYVIAEIGGQHYVIRRVERNEKIITKIEKEVEIFWNKYVARKLIPPALIPDDLEDSEELSEEIVIASPDEADILAELYNTKEVIKIFKAKAERIEVYFKERLKGNIKLESDDYSCKYSRRPKKEVDEKELAQKDYELYKQYLVSKEVFDEAKFLKEIPDSPYIKDTVSRRFTLRKKKKKEK